MVVDDRVTRLQRHGTLHDRHGLFIRPKAVQDPAQGIGDVAVVRPLGDGGLDHRLGLFEIDSLLNPTVAEVVQDQRLFGFYFKCAEEVLFRAVPFLGPLQRDAARVE